MLVGLSTLMTPFLNLIPMPVLYGVFLFMGTSALEDIHLYHRMRIALIPVKYQPDYDFLRQVSFVSMLILMLNFGVPIFKILSKFLHLGPSETRSFVHLYPTDLLRRSLDR